MAEKRRRFQKYSPGTVKAVIFIILIAVAIAIWVYTQIIFNHVREFQKLVARIQVAIYVDIIDPTLPDVSSLFEYVKDSPLPRIITDDQLNPIQGLWQNVDIQPDKKDEASYRKLRRLIENMDETNPPEKIPRLRLDHRTDTLTVFEYPPSRSFPVVVTDTLGTYLYSRAINADISDSLGLKIIIGKLDMISMPLVFIQKDEPPLVFHGINARSIWPILVKKKNGEPLYWSDVNVARNDTTTEGRQKLENFVKLVTEHGLIYDIVTNYDVIVLDTWLFHYGDVPFLSWIGWLPVIEFIVLLILLFVGFMGFKNITNAEQRSIWVGMAKETAHQLGTPISSLGGWLELLKTDRDKPLVDQAVTEMERDVERLTRVAARFSSIGSKPELQLIDLSEVIDGVLDYFRVRAPRMERSVTFDGQYQGLRYIKGSHELLNWAFENLVKNSLASIESKDGIITVKGSMSKDFKHVILDFIDNGKGIPYSEQKKVMQPGFTTKKRGWGLGLSLVKRIIEDYHDGKIFLSDSKPGAGTTFRIILPAIEHEKAVNNEKKNTLGR
ncbi:MAG: HAMP domain-containing histidine kinase [Candidatus Latescibacteria bacterium]|nr:HAMP domain-containing histidine kinase [Candidatus Latescibacterota bacterium]